MATAPNKSCRAVGCGARVGLGTSHCIRHKGQDRKRQDERRGSSTERGYDSRWQKYRKNYLFDNPLCLGCEAEGYSRVATVVDHIIPHRGNQALFWEPSNHQALCRKCHDRKTVLESKETPFDKLLYPENIRQPGIEVIIICGPPGSGKNTYVEKRKKQGDTVIDLDQIREEISGLRLYQAGDAFIAPALRERNRRLDSLADKRKGKAWFIVTAPQRTQRLFWKQKLTASEVIVLDVPADECKKRILEDLRRGNKRNEHCKAVDKWWRLYNQDGKRENEDVPNNL